MVAKIAYLQALKAPICDFLAGPASEGARIVSGRLSAMIQPASEMFRWRDAIWPAMETCNLANNCRRGEPGHRDMHLCEYILITGVYRPSARPKNGKLKKVRNVLNVV